MVDFRRMQQFVAIGIDHATVLDDVPHNPAIEDLRHFPGAPVRRVDRDKQSKSPLTKIVGTPVYKQMTARNINTVRKLVELADADASARR